MMSIIGERNREDFGIPVVGAIAESMSVNIRHLFKFFYYAIM